MAVLVVHGGAGAPPEAFRSSLQAAVERGLDAGWSRIAGGAVDAVCAAVRHMEDEPDLNAGVGASLNLDGDAELDAGLMEGSGLRAGAIGAVRDIRNPIDLARAIMADGRHVLLVGEGASRFAREHAISTCGQDVFVTKRRRQQWEAGDTVGAVALDSSGQTAVAVSTGGTARKWPGRLGDSPLPGAGFYADDSGGAACGTGQGEGFIRLALGHWAVAQMARGRPAAEVAKEGIQQLAQRVEGSGGLITVDARGGVGASFNTPFMAFAVRDG